MLYRYGRNGEFAGDTWHKTVEDAIDQIEFEFNLNRVKWIEIPKDIDDPIEFAIECMRDNNR